MGTRVCRGRLLLFLTLIWAVSIEICIGVIITPPESTIIQSAVSSDDAVDQYVSSLPGREQTCSPTCSESGGNTRMDNNEGLRDIISGGLGDGLNEIASKLVTIEISSTKTAERMSDDVGHKQKIGVNANGIQENVEDTAINVGQGCLQRSSEDIEADVEADIGADVEDDVAIKKTVTRNTAPDLVRESGDTRVGDEDMADALMHTDTQTSMLKVDGVRASENEHIHGKRLDHDENDVKNNGGSVAEGLGVLDSFITGTISGISSPSGRCEVDGRSGRGREGVDIDEGDGDRESVGVGSVVRLGSINRSGFKLQPHNTQQQLQFNRACESTENEKIASTLRVEKPNLQPQSQRKSDTCKNTLPAYAIGMNSGMRMGVQDENFVDVDIQVVVDDVETGANGVAIKLAVGGLVKSEGTIVASELKCHPKDVNISLGADFGVGDNTNDTNMANVSISDMKTEAKVEILQNEINELKSIVRLLSAAGGQPEPQTTENTPLRNASETPSTSPPSSASTLSQPVELKHTNHIHSETPSPSLYIKSQTQKDRQNDKTREKYSFKDGDRKPSDEAAVERKKKLIAKDRTWLTTDTRRYNYASYDCNAKVLYSNAESERSKSILVDDKDRYSLNLCNAKSKFYVIQLCESVRILSFQVSNYEYFSSIVKTLSLYVADQYPTQNWQYVGTYTNNHMNRSITFDVHQEDDWFLFDYFKYVKVQFGDHYGDETYCPTTQIKIWGKTMFDDWIKDSSAKKSNATKGAIEDDESVLSFDTDLLAYWWERVMQLPEIIECIFTRALNKHDPWMCVGFGVNAPTLTDFQKQGTDDIPATEYTESDEPNLADDLWAGLPIYPPSYKSDAICFENEHCNVVNSMRNDQLEPTPSVRAQMEIKTPVTVTLPPTHERTSQSSITARAVVCTEPNCSEEPPNPVDVNTDIDAGISNRASIARSTTTTPGLYSHVSKHIHKAEVVEQVNREQDNIKDVEEINDVPTTPLVEINKNVGVRNSIGNYAPTYSVSPTPSSVRGSAELNEGLKGAHVRMVSESIFDSVISHAPPLASTMKQLHNSESVGVYVRDTVDESTEMGLDTGRHVKAGTDMDIPTDTRSRITGERTRLLDTMVLAPLELSLAKGFPDFKDLVHCPPIDSDRWRKFLSETQCTSAQGRWLKIDHTLRTYSHTTHTATQRGITNTDETMDMGTTAGPEGGVWNDVSILTGIQELCSEYEWLWRCFNMRSLLSSIVTQTVGLVGDTVHKNMNEHGLKSETSADGLDALQASADDQMTIHPPKLDLREDNDGPGGVFWKFDAKMQLLEAYAEENSRYLEELHERYVAPHTAMHTASVLKLSQALRKQHALIHQTIIPQIEELQHTWLVQYNDLGLVKTKMDVMEDWGRWGFTVTVCIAILYSLLTMCVYAGRFLMTFFSRKQVKLNTTKRVTHRANSSDGTIDLLMNGIKPQPRLLPHKSTIQSLDLNDPNGRSARYPTTGYVAHNKESGGVGLMNIGVPSVTLSMDTHNMHEDERAELGGGSSRMHLQKLISSNVGEVEDDDSNDLVRRNMSFKREGLRTSELTSGKSSPDVALHGGIGSVRGTIPTRTNTDHKVSPPQNQWPQMGRIPVGGKGEGLGIAGKSNTDQGICISPVTVEHKIVKSSASVPKKAKKKKKRQVGIALTKS
eukprot:CFRG7263T1